MKKVVLVIFILVSMVYAKEVNIAVAANVSYAIDALKTTFEKSYPDISVQVTLGSSGKLMAQIAHGAPYGVFLSANMLYPQTLYKQRQAVEKPKVYAQGELALFSVKSLDFSKGIKLLDEKKIRRIAVANPKTAPYGKAAFEAFQRAGILKNIKKKIVYGESIAQTVSYSMMATDIGVIAKSSLYSDKMKRFNEGTHWVSVDNELYTPIKQGVVLLKNTPENRVFYDFILSDEAKVIFKKYGYLVQ
jgi:molybdate transport system substrate-binding protein